MSPSSHDAPAEAAHAELAQIYRDHFDAIWQHLRRMGVAEADREDLAQEVFVTAYQRLASLDRTRPVRPWLFGICTRLVLHHWRRVQRRPADQATSSHAWDECLERGRQASEPGERQLLEALLATVDVERRALFVLHELAGFSVPEIAEITGDPENTIYSRLRRTRETLSQQAQRWEQECG